MASLPADEKVEMAGAEQRQADVESANQPNLDFRSLQAAVDRVRKQAGQRDASVCAELATIANEPRRDPFRPRHPTFRWRLIPAVYCAFHAAVCIGGLVSYDVYGNASFSGYRQTAIAVAHLLLFSCAAACWLKNYWMCGIALLLAVMAFNHWVH